MICHAIPEFKNQFGFAEFCEVWLVVNSRTYNIKFDENTEMQCLVPFADMLNQKHP